jgi:hypothetical protein
MRWNVSPINCTAWEDASVNPIERRVRAHIMNGLRETGEAPSVGQVSDSLEISRADVIAGLHSLAAQHRLVLRPASDAIWMAHPFSGIETDFVVNACGRTWYANCVWDGLSILGLVGDGRLETHSPQTGEAIRFDVEDGRVVGDAIVHFLVPAKLFWDDIGFT